MTLFGALADAAATAGFAGLAIAAVRTDHAPNLKKVRGQITGLVNAKFKSLPVQDREALFEGVNEAIQSLEIDETLVRATNHPTRLFDLVLSRSLESLASVMDDPATSDCAHRLLRIICDWIASEVERAPKFVPIRLSEAVSDVRDHAGRLDQITDSHIALRVRVDSFEGQISHLDHAIRLVQSRTVAALVSPSTLFVSAVDLRPLAPLTVSRDHEIGQVARSVGERGYATIAGRELSGRFEIARGWCAQAGRLEHAHAVSYSSPQQLAAAVDLLASAYGVETSGDIATVLSRLLWSRPHVSVIVCAIDRVDLLERILEAQTPNSGALILTVLESVGKRLPGCVVAEDLDDSAIHALLVAELPNYDALDLRPLAASLAGLPESARVAAAALRDAGAESVALLSSLVTDPSLVLSTPLEPTQANRTQTSVWAKSLQLFEQSMRRDGRAILAAMHVMQSRALDTQLGLTLSLLWSGGDEGQLEVAGQSYPMVRQTLSRLGLVGESSGFVSVQPLLASHCWEQLTEDERRVVVRACIKGARMAADRGRYSFAVVYYYCAAWLQDPDTSPYRRYDAAAFDAAVIQLANLMSQLDLREHAIVMLTRLIQLQAEDEHASTWPSSVRIAMNALRTGPHEWADEYVRLLQRERETTTEELSTQDECELWLLVAESCWLRSDLEGTLDALNRGWTLLDASKMEGLEMVESGYSRLRGRARVALGDLAQGLEDLERGLDLLAPIVGPHGLEEYRSHTQQFLYRNGHDAWRDWRDRDLESLSPRDQPTTVSIGVNSSWIAAAAARSVGDHSGAAHHIDSGLPEGFETDPHGIYGVGEHYRAIWQAERAVHRAGLAIESPTSVPPAELRDRLDELTEALERIEGLSTEERSLPRVEGWRNSLWIQKANLCVKLGELPEAEDLARRALDSDALLHGTDHGEYADDAGVLANVYFESATGVQDPVLRKVRHYLELAAPIYATPGPHRNVEELAAIESALETLSEMGL